MRRHRTILASLKASLILAKRNFYLKYEFTFWSKWVPSIPTGLKSTAHNAYTAPTSTFMRSAVTMALRRLLSRAGELQRTCTAPTTRLLSHRPEWGLPLLQAQRLLQPLSAGARIRPDSSQTTPPEALCSAGQRRCPLQARRPEQVLPRGVQLLQAQRLCEQLPVVFVGGLALRKLLHAGRHKVHDHQEDDAGPG